MAKSIRKINTKIFFIKTIFVILSLIITSVILFALYSMNLIDSETTKKFQFHEEALLNSIESNILVNKASTIIFANNIGVYGPQLNENQILQLLQKNIKANPNIFGTGIWFEPYKYKKNLKYFGPYCYYDKNNNLVTTFEYNTPQYNYFAWDWYKNAKNKQRAAIWSIPYYDSILKTTFITLSVPIYNNDNFIGTVTTDFTLRTLQEIIKNTQVSNNGWIFIIDKKGDYIASSKNAKINQKNILVEKDKNLVKFGQKVLNQEKGLTTLNLNNKKNLIYFAPISDTGLYLVSIVPSKDLFGYTIFSTIGAGFLLTIILFLLLNFIVLKYEKFNQSRLNLILENMNNGVIIANKNFVIEYYNSAINNLFLYSKDDLLDANLNTIFPDKNIFENFDNNSNIETIGLKKNKVNVLVEIKISKVFISNGNKYILDVYDVSKHKEVEKLKDEFVSVISHELRTPLTSLSGALELISMNTLNILPEKIGSLLKIATNNTTRLINLINDILDLEKIKAGKISFNFENHEVMELIREAVQLNEEYAKIYNVKYEIINEMNNILVDVDKDRFIQVLTNLLSNAAKFSYPNEIIKIEVNMKNDLVSVLITNKGCGIPKEYYSKIFEPFSQVDSSDNRNKGGTGLGLSISKSIIENMNGKIDFYSKLNEETTFYIELPIFKKETVISDNGVKK